MRIATIQGKEITITTNDGLMVHIHADGSVTLETRVGNKWNMRGEYGQLAVKANDSTAYLSRDLQLKLEQPHKP